MILQNLIDYVDDAGSSAVLPNIHRALDQDGDDVSKRSRCAAGAKCSRETQPACSRDRDDREPSHQATASLL